MARKLGLVTVIDKTAQLSRAIDVLTGTRVMVGVPAEHDDREDENKSGLNNAEIGYLMENGIPERNVPARPHMKPGVKRAQSKINDYLKQAGRLALEGKPDAVMRAFHAVGLTAQNSIKGVIREGVPPPLAPSTLAARRRRGRTGEKPLIDTGQYLASITYVIRKISTAARQIGRARK